MSERGSTRTLSSIGDGEGYISSGTEVAIIEGLGKYREGKKWKQRFFILSKLSPAADCLQLQIYRDEKERARNGHTKASLSLQHFLAVESGFTLDKESHTLAIICQDLIVVLAFDNRERLIQWTVRIASNLGEAQQFLVQLASAPVKSKLTPGPVKLHVTDKRFCLTGGIPPRLLGVWEISHLRRYGLVDGRLVFEGGSRCGKGEGVYVLIPDPPQLSHIIDVFDMSSKGQLTRMPSRRFGSVLDSPRKSLGASSRFSEVRSTHHAELSSNCNGNGNQYKGTLSPTPRESRSAEELCAAAEDSNGTASGLWMASDTSSRSDIDNCDNRSTCQIPNHQPSSSPVKQTVGKPLPSSMERCLSCMSKLGQGNVYDILSPSWTMDLSTNSACHNTSLGSGNSDRLSISSHGSHGSGGAAVDFCYDTPRSVLVNEIRRGHRSSTPPAQHNCTTCHGRTCVTVSGRSCESPQRNATGRNGCAAQAHMNCLCQHHHPQQVGTAAGPIYYSIPEQPSKQGPFENYDVPRSALLHASRMNCCSGSCAFNSTSSIEWSKKQPMDRGSIATSTCSDPLPDWYDTPRRHDSLSQGNACHCCSANVQNVPNYDNSCANSSSYNPLENYDFPQASAIPVTEKISHIQHQSLPSGRVNGEGKMPLVVSSVNSQPAKIPLNPQAIYAQVDKSKKTPKPLPPQPACDTNDAHCQPLYMNVAPGEKCSKTTELPPTVAIHNTQDKTAQKAQILPNKGSQQQHNNYVNLDFVDSLQLYENSKEVRQNHVTKDSHLVETIQIQRKVEDSQTEIKDIQKSEEKVLSKSKDAEVSQKIQEGPTSSQQLYENVNPKPKVENDVVSLPLRRSSSVPCKGGHSNRASASSSDSGVSGDGGLYFDDSSPLNDFGNSCIHESLPRKGQRLSPGSSAGKNPSIASTPKPQSSEESELLKTEESTGKSDHVQNKMNSAEVEEVQLSTSPRHYETIDEIEPVKVIPTCMPVSNKILEAIPRRVLKNPTSSLVSDNNSTSSGASDMSDYLETLSSCSRGSIDMGHNQHHSAFFAHQHLNNSIPVNSSNNISSSPKKSAYMKPRSGKEYSKIDRSVFSK